MQFYIFLSCYTVEVVSPPAWEDGCGFIKLLFILDTTRIHDVFMRWLPGQAKALDIWRMETKVEAPWKRMYCRSCGITKFNAVDFVLFAKGYRIYKLILS